MSPESRGEKFKKIRLEKGLSLEEVQKRTKIHLNILKAIEEDTLVNLSPIYIKGFLKIYAKFLGVEPKDYISDEEKKIEPPMLKVEPKNKQPIELFEDKSFRPGFFRLSRKIRIIFIVIIVFIVFSIALFSLGKNISYKQHSSIKKGKQQAPSVTPKPKPKSTQVVPKKASSSIQLSVLAREDCWMVIKIDGHLIFQGTLKKGKSESWQAKDKVELSLGNAGVVELIVNGERISSLGKRGQPRKNIIITKEGLSIS